MGAISDFGESLPDAISLALGKITLDRDHKEAVLQGHVAGRKIRVVASYENADFTVAQVRRDFNEALDKFHPIGKEKEPIDLSKNVRLYFESPTAKKATMAAITKMPRGKKGNVHFAEREEARLMFRDTQFEEKRVPGEKGKPKATRPVTQQHPQKRGPTLSAQSIREEFGRTRVPLESLTLDSFRRMDLDWLYEQALAELKPNPTDQEIYKKMFQLNHRSMDCSEEELCSILSDMKRLPERQLDLKKGMIAFHLISQARAALKDESSTFENLERELKRLNNPRSQLTHAEMATLLAQLKKMVAANPIVDQPQWDKALTNVSAALRAVTKEEHTLDSVKKLMGLQTQKERMIETKVYDKLRVSFLALVPRLGSPLDNLDEVKEALSQLLGRAEGANLTIDPKMKQGRLVYEINYIIATREQMKERSRA